MLPLKNYKKEFIDREGDTITVYTLRGKKPSQPILFNYTFFIKDTGNNKY